MERSLCLFPSDAEQIQQSISMKTGSKKRSAAPLKVQQTAKPKKYKIVTNKQGKKEKKAQQTETAIEITDSEDSVTQIPKDETEKKENDSDVEEVVPKRSKMYPDPDKMLLIRRQREIERMLGHKYESKKPKKKKSTKEIEEIEYEDYWTSKIDKAIKAKLPKCPQRQIINAKDSQKILHLFSLNGGDYKEISKQFPHIIAPAIRRHVHDILVDSIWTITNRVKQKGRKIVDWQPEEMKEILKEMHKIRTSNRLLSQKNVHLRDNLTLVMKSVHQPDVIINDDDLEIAYKTIEAFARGFNHINKYKYRVDMPIQSQTASLEISKSLRQSRSVPRQRSEKKKSRSEKKSKKEDTRSHRSRSQKKEHADIYTSSSNSDSD